MAYVFKIKTLSGDFISVPALKGKDGEASPEYIAMGEMVEEKAGEVEDNTEIVVQTMSDFLAMMGTDVATLTGGKLTPSQIPAIAITETFVVNSQAEMLALTCETGDVAIRNDESKTYILQGTDPSVLAHWQQLKVPTNYADEAGHALTADEAVNAEKINGHRVVYMTQAQYDVAVKEENTIYMVGD